MDIPNPPFDRENALGPERLAPEAVTANPELFDDSARLFGDEYGLDPLLQAALLSDKTKLHVFGVEEFDHWIRAAITKQKDLLLGEIKRVLKSVASDKTKISDRADDSKAQLTRRARRQADRKAEWEKVHDSEGYDELLQALQKAAEQNIDSLGPLDPILRSLTTIYAPELTIFPNLEHELSETDKELFAGFLTPEEIANRLTKIEFAQLLRQRTNIDISKETTDERYENIFALLQIGMTERFLRAISDLSAPGGNKGKRALSILKKHHAGLFQDDLAGKIDMLSELAAAFEQFARTTPSGPLSHKIRTILEAWGNVLSEIIRGIDELKIIFREIYTVRGYELPDSLVPLEMTVDTARPMGTGTTEGVSGPTPEELRRQFIEDLGALQAVNDQLIADWRLSGKIRKSAGLDDLQRILVTGFTTGDLALSGVPKEIAQRTAEILYILHDHATRLGLSATREQMEEAEQVQFELERMLAQLQELRQQSKSTTPIPDIFRINDFLTAIRDNWPAYRRLIIETWPGREGQAVAGRLEQLFFGSDDEPEEIEEPVAETTDADSQQEIESANDKVEVEQPPTPSPAAEIGQRAVGLSLPQIEANVVEQLDEIILPPETRDELERVLNQDRRPRESRIKVDEDTWARFEDLVQIRNYFGGKLYRSKRSWLGHSQPYFIAVVSYEGDAFAIAESPLLGNATYVVAEKHVPGTWLEVLTLHKIDARQVGAERVIHSPEAPYGPAHLAKVQRVMIDLHITKPTL